MKNRKQQVKDTKKTILDKAEELFANHGIGTYSLRKIATKADVDPALITYHFGNKDALVEAVLERRISELNELRSQALANVLKRTKNKPTMEDIHRALWEPWKDKYQSGDPGWRYYSKLAARMMVMPWVADIMDKYMRPIETQWINAIRLAQPDITEEELFWRIMFSLGGAIALFSESRRVELAANKKISDEDIDQGFEIFIKQIST